MSLLRHDFEALTSVTDEIDSLLGLVGVTKAKQLDPLKPSDLGKISRRIGASLKRAVAGGEAAAMKAAIDELDVDWVNLSTAAQRKVIDAARRQAKKVIIDKTLPKVDQVFTANVKPIYKNSKIAAIAKHNLQINFSLSSQDADIARFVADSQSNFITNQYGQRLAKMGTNVRAIVAEGTKRGAGSAEIVRDLQKNLPELSQVGRRQFYWEVVAMSFANRARNYAGIVSYGEAGIEWYRWESVLDEVTTETCRFLHGKRFSTGAELSRVESLEENTDNPEQIKQIQPWVSVGRNSDGEKSLFFRGPSGQKRHIATVLKPGQGKADVRGVYSSKMTDKQLGDSGISMPPIHGLCRSTTVPDLSGPSPRVAPVEPAPRPSQVAAKPQKIPKSAEPKVGKQFEKFASDLSKDDEKLMMRTIDDLGLTKVMEKNKLGRLVFTSKVGRDGFQTASIGKRTNGVFYHGLNVDGHPKQNPVLKVLSKRSDAAGWEFKEGVASKWGISETGRTPRAKMQTTFTHELGHYITKIGERQKLRGGRKLVLDHAGSSEEYKQVDKIMKSAFRRRAKDPLNRVSMYAQTNRDEYFAESFAAHAMDPVTLKAKDPVAFEMVEEVRKIHGLDPVKRLIDGK